MSAGGGAPPAPTRYTAGNDLDLRAHVGGDADGPRTRRTTKGGAVAFDPVQEDCLRLILGHMSRERIFPLDDGAYIARRMSQFEEDPSQLIETDAERSFHLTAQAVEATDYRVPLLTDEAEIHREEDAAADHLREAVDLDPRNWDAKRMLAELDAESNDAFLDFLLDGRDEVALDTARAIAAAQDPYGREFARDLAHRPYLRWLAAIASRALISGRYGMALRVAEESLAYAGDDPAGVRHTAVLAMAKLEVDPDEIKRFRRRHAQAYQAENPQRRRHHLTEKELDPWTLIAQMDLAYRALDYDGANRALRALVRSCPHAAQALYYQTEFPEGLFCRVNVIPGSDDELMVALSEATPLLQEGLGSPDNAGFSLWISENDLVASAISPAERERERPAAGGRAAGGEA